MAKLLPYLKQSAIYIRISLGGSQAEISTGLKIAPDLWDAQAKRMKGNNKTSDSVNRRLAEVLSRLRNIETDLIGKGQPYTPADIKDRFTGKADAHRTFLRVFDQFVTNLEEQPESTRLAPSSLVQYRLRYKNISGFVASLKKPDIHLHQVDEDFMEALQRYLLKEKGLALGTVSKHLGAVKTVMRYALKRRYIVASHAETFKIPKENYAGRDIVFLTEQQLHALESHPFEGNVREIVDACVFQAHTGMGYREVLDLCPDWLYRGTDGRPWVEFFRQKTKKRKTQKVRVPLDETALQILERYKSHPKCRMSGRCLPVRSNQEYNRQLKALAAAFELPPDLSTHHFRKTAGMLLLNGGVPVETVAEILGDTVPVLRTHYARVLEQKISRDMAGYWDRIKNNHN